MSYHWSIHQLTEYLVVVSKPQEPEAALLVALERAIEALDAELGAVMIDGEVRATAGFGLQDVSESFVTAAADEDRLIDIPGVGACHTLRADLNRPDSSSGSDAWLVVGRLGESYSAEEDQMLRGMAIVLGLVLRNLQALQVERARHQLFETLLEIQRAISAHRPLDELLDAITAGASALLGGCPIELLLVDPLTHGRLIPASVKAGAEFGEDAINAAAGLLRGDLTGFPEIEAAGSAMIVEPVVVAGDTAGCLVARPDQHGPRRREQGEMLTAFAQQVSLALTDAQALDALHEAHHDPITLLPNRRLFIERLEEARRAALAGAIDLTVLFIDLDSFKSVNDTHGHQVGDELLAEVARRISRCIRTDDTAGRLGGDEFAVLVDRGGVAAGKKLAARIADSLESPMMLGDQELFVSASIGIAPLTPFHQDAGALLSDADTAMYRAKRSGPGQWMTFEPGMRLATPVL